MTAWSDPYFRVRYSVVAAREQPPPPGGTPPETLIEPPLEPLTPDELTAIARIVPGDSEAALLPLYISAARQQAELDTDLAIAQQQYIVTFDALPSGTAIDLPRPPLVSIDAVVWIDVDDVAHPVDPTYYRADTSSRPGRLIWTPPGDYVAPADARSYQAWMVTITAGWDPPSVPVALKRAIGLLATHYLTTGRDQVVIGTIVQSMPDAYEDAIARFRQVTVP
jgi:uncharacterized phiE125 gp8 family phage protein